MLYIAQKKVKDILEGGCFRERRQGVSFTLLFVLMWNTFDIYEKV